MPLQRGDKLGPYEILAPIGAGGMGEVWKARDTRLDRIVAIKVSKTEFSERFEREARAVAALNHPNICQLYDVGPNYLVMEFVEGTPLKGPLPLEKAIEYSGQVLDALDAAHRKGITHRDLKPANILVTKRGIKLLDFGLAKIEKPAAVDQATMTMALTGEGQILGTLYYMSPEQLQEGEAGPASDIFSFGLVLYEMLTGKRAFDGKSQASLIAAILERPAPSIADVAPPALDRVLKRCLEKDPENRWRSTWDLKAALECMVTVPEREFTGPSRSRLGKLPWAVAALLLIALLGVSFVHFREARVAPLALRLPIAFPEISNFNYVALSPDGRMLVLGATSITGQSQLYLRSLDSAELRPLAGITGATPFWSADGRSIGFFADGKLKIVSAGGGPVQTLCDAGIGGGGTWNRDGVILFGSSNTPRRILRVSVSDGACTPVLTPEGSTKYQMPVFLPDGGHFFYESDGGGDESKAGVFIASLDNPVGRRVLADQSSVIYAPPESGGKLAHLIFMREATLMAQPFDPAKLRPTGDVFQVATQASFSGNQPQEAATVSTNGVLVYLSNRFPDLQLAWFDRSGKELGKVGPRARVRVPHFSLSPDGKTVAVSRVDAATDRYVMWLDDLTRGVESRFTVLPQSSENPVWSPDGARIAFSMNRQDLYLKETSSGLEEPLVRNANQKTPSDWSPDNRFLLYTEADPKNQGDIWILSDPLNKSGARKSIPFLRSRFNESEAQFSPDGRWVAYTSDESGHYEVYIRPFPTPAAGSDVKWQVSSGSQRAVQPRWRSDGKELFYLQVASPSYRLMAMPISPGPRPIAADALPRPLFEFRGASVNPWGNVFSFNSSADGQRFLVSAYADEHVLPTLNVLVNWQVVARKGATAP